MDRRKGWLYSLGLIGMLCGGVLPAHADPPTDLKGTDFGAPDQPGSHTIDATNGTVTVTAGGNDIWGNSSDQGYFLYKTVSGDYNITMRFLEKRNHDIGTPAKSGPLMRATLDNDSVSAFLPFQGERFVDPHFRFETGGATTNFDIEDRGHPPSPTTPLWQRLERQGNRVSGLISDDGKVWNSLISVTMDNMPAQVLTGLGATKHSASGETPVTVLYDNFTIATDLSPQNVTGIGQDKGAMVTWNAVTGAEGYNVYTLGADKKLTPVTTSPITGTSIQLQNLENGKPATVIVAAVQGGKEGIGVETVVTPAPPVGAGLQGININTLVPGTASADANGVITMQGAGYVIGDIGDNIAGRSDGFYYLAMPMGDGTATVRLVDGPNADRDDNNRQAGIMIRETLDQDARFVMMESTSGNGAHLQVRAKASDMATATDADVADPAARPIWLRVVRKGDSFTAFVSEDKDGATYRQVGDAVIIAGFSPSAYVGLALSPRTGFGAYYPAALPLPTETAQATFDNLTIK